MSEGLAGRQSPEGVACAVGIRYHFDMSAYNNIKASKSGITT